MQTKISRWLPSLLVMLVIFVISTQPADQLPNFKWADLIIKKGGHLLAYGLLALSYWYAFAWSGSNRWLVWILVMVYAFTDEFHQSFVPGRHPSIWDVLIFDNLGALISLWLANRHFKLNRPDV